MLEQDLVVLLGKKQNYSKYQKFIPFDNLNKLTVDILKHLPDYFRDTGKDETDWDDFYTWYVSIRHPLTKTDTAIILKAYCTKLKETIGVDQTVLKNLFVRSTAAEISDLASLVAVDGKLELMEDIIAAIEHYRIQMRDMAGEKYKIYTGLAALEALLDELDTGKKFNWKLNELQISLGPLQKGDFIIVGARPDGGKTTFLSTQVTHFAQQLDPEQRILWLNNEEAPVKVAMRQMQAVLGWSQPEIDSDKKLAASEYDKKLGADKIITVDKTDMSIRDIDELVNIYKPAMIVIDQIWKVSGYEKEGNSDIARYALLAKHVRGLAKEWGPVIVTSQLDGNAEGHKYPDMAALYNSKTAVQGEADAIIIIGRDPAEPPNIRFIHTPKNKLSFGDPTRRNQAWVVELDATYGQFHSKVAMP